MDSIRASRLTDRQRLCLRLVHAHRSSKEIATQVGIGPGTVDQHIKAAMLILGVSDRREAARMLVNHEAAASERPVEAATETARAAISPRINVMADILASARHGLSNVLSFSGRDTPEQFRRYAILLIVLGLAIPNVIIHLRVSIVFMRLQQLAATHPGQFGNALEWKRRHPELMPDFSDLPFILGLIALLYLALIAAAVARRRHDWSWTELWGSLALPIANIAFMIEPPILFHGILAASTSLLLYVLIRGGAPERIVGAIGLVGTAVLFLAFLEAPLLSPVLDSATLLAFLLVALRANRFWPIWLAAIHGLGLAANLITLMNPMIDPAAYGLTMAIGAPFTYLILFVGTRNHQLRLRQNGVDPAWTPLGRSRRPPEISGREQGQAAEGRYAGT